MYLLVNVTGNYWRLNYRVNGKQKTLALGIYPEASLATARKLHERARRQLVTGLISWCCSKKAEASLVRAQLDTFLMSGHEWLEKSGARGAENAQVRAAS
jgi:hypothetical protein